jgi:radical SAM protein with 4Fe4S-binding SPASM domain
MQVESFENVVLSTTINPLLKSLISKFDVYCPEDGSLLLNSLKLFLGGNVRLCNHCESLNRKIAQPFYELGCRLLRANKTFMSGKFLDPVNGEVWLRGFALMMRGIEKYGIRIPFVPAAPFEIVWNYTYLCNLKCKHCYEDAGKRKSELTTEETFQVIDILSKIGGYGLPALSFSGGEPLARKDFFEVASYAKKRIPFLSLATNGTLLTKDNAKRLKDVGFNYVEISLDGATKKVHEEFRGIPGCFEKTIQGIRNSVEAGLDTCIATVFHKQNINEVEKILKLADELHTRFIHFNYIPTGRAKIHAELDLNPKERRAILEILGEKIVDLYMKTKAEEEKLGRAQAEFGTIFSTCPQFAPVVKEISQRKGENFTVSAHYGAVKGIENIANFLGGCGAGRLYIAIEPNGDIKPCVFFPTKKDTVIGNILKDDFDQLWSSHPLLWLLRSREKLKTYEFNGRTVGCGGCQNKYICGGCRARSYGYFNGDVCEPDIGCLNNQALWETVTKALEKQ